MVLVPIRFDGFFETEPVPKERFLTGKSDIEWDTLCRSYAIGGKSLVFFRR